MIVESNLFLFRLGAPDAERLAVYVRPQFSAQALQNLPNFHAVARMLVEGEPTRPFVLQAAAPEPCPALPAAQRLFREAAIARVRARQHPAGRRGGGGAAGAQAGGHGAGSGPRRH